jgi:chaperonin GroES
MKFKPLGERALVQIVEREETTASGIVLPDTAKEKPQTASVVAVGQFEDGVKVSEGDVIVFAKYSGTEISLDGEDYMILDADDILGIVESSRVGQGLALRSAGRIRPALLFWPEDSGR